LTLVYWSRHLAIHDEPRIEEPLAVPKKSKSPRISESQLQAYRNRRASAPVTDGESAPQAKAGEATVATTSWGRLDEEYAMIRSDLIRLLILAAAMIGLIVALSFVLG
jgi:hypothetical protein